MIPNRRRALRIAASCATALTAVLGLTLSPAAPVNGVGTTSGSGWAERASAGAHVAFATGSHTDRAGSSAEHGAVTGIPSLGTTPTGSAAAGATTDGAGASPSEVGEVPTVGADDPGPRTTGFPPAWTTATPSTASPTDVVFVHGAGCGAMQYTVDAMKVEEAEMGLPASTFHTVGYYSCDTSGVSILNAGSAGYLPSTDGNGTNTDIKRIAYELAWYLWDTFGSRDKPVDLVGHSLGGIAIAYALQRIAAHDPEYPTSLIVHSVTTFSSPFGGVSSSLCAASPSLECTELLTGSSLLDQIDAAGAVDLGGQTQWTLVGSDGADQIPSSSTLMLPGATTRIDYTSPIYTHTSYLLDTSTAKDASGTINGSAFSDGDHSLALLATLLI